MQVVEKFVSINGEGAHAGELAAFIRFKGCNMVCSYCDTSWANEPDCPYEDMSPGAIADFVKETGVANVTLTGGEPLLQPDMKSLLQHLHKNDLRVEIETNGSVDLTPFCEEHRPVFTMDYKLPSSGCEDRNLPSNFSLLERRDTVKFVCGSKADLDRADEVIRAHELSGKCYIYLSPVFGRIEPSEMVEFMMGHRMNGVRLQLQLHKYIWDPEAKGV